MVSSRASGAKRTQSRDLVFLRVLCGSSSRSLRLKAFLSVLCGLRLFPRTTTNLMMERYSEAREWYYNLWLDVYKTQCVDGFPPGRTPHNLHHGPNSRRFRVVKLWHRRFPQHHGSHARWCTPSNEYLPSNRERKSCGRQVSRDPGTYPLR